jgi:hypothetical protein
MREWNLSNDDPLELTLCSDARLVPTDYVNDQVWKLVIGFGEPPALVMQTTFGLRARSFRIFPRFNLNSRFVSDPGAFFTTVKFHKIYPNYIQLSYSPFKSIDVTAEYWVPDSASIGCRLKILNSSDETANLGIEWAALLTPQAGESMAPLEMEASRILCGKTGELSPVVFTTGNRESSISPFPALIAHEEIMPNQDWSITLSQSTKQETEESFRFARKMAARAWEAEISRVEMQNSGLIGIYTGDPDWDIALALSQKIAHSLIMSPSTHLPGHSFVLTRQPDLGYSLRGDGTDYGFLWNGQTPLDAFYLIGLLNPGDVGLAKDIFRNFLHVADETGFIDLKPGLAGQRSRLLATPVLATMAWQIYKTSEDQAFLGQVYPSLQKFFELWFNTAHDRDQDGFPEWDHTLQSGFEEHPAFSSWFEWSRGVDITTAESPSLCAFLYRECHSLINIAAQIQRTEKSSYLEKVSDRLRNLAETLWSDESCAYIYRDRDTHVSPKETMLAQQNGAGSLELGLYFDQPVRLLVSINSPGERTLKPKIVIRGVSASGQNRIENINFDQFHWNMGRGNMTGSRVYRQIDQIEVSDVSQSDQITIQTIGYDILDQTSLLPLWAGLPEQEEGSKIISKTVMNPDKFWMPYGIPAYPLESPDTDIEAYQSVHMQFNSFIGEGLIRYGARDVAGDLFTRLITACVRSLKEEKAFRRYYHAKSGKSFGERNTLGGLPPLKLFLDILGIRIISNKKVNLQGINPFPWPVTVKYKGMSILRGKEKTSVNFANGQSIIVEEPDACTVNLE